MSASAIPAPTTTAGRTNALFGQSYQLGGENSFAAPDLVNVGAYSGLETDTSDFVGLFGFTSPNGFSASVSGRFDEQTFEVRRAEVKAGLFRPAGVAERQIRLHPGPAALRLHARSP